MKKNAEMLLTIFYVRNIAYNSVFASFLSQKIAKCGFYKFPPDFGGKKKERNRAKGAP